jgi:RNA-binding protein 26
MAVGHDTIIESGFSVSIITSFFSNQEERTKRRSPRDRRQDGSSPRRRRSSGHRVRHRSRSRSPAAGRRSPPFGRRGRRVSPFGARRSRSFSPRRGSRSPPPPLPPPLLPPPPPTAARRYTSRGSTPTRDEEGATYTPTVTTVGKRPRCRDYDEKGYCLRGDQCKFDHGNDAVVLEDTTNTSVPPPPYLPGGYTEPYVPATTGPILPPLHLPPPGYAATTVPRKRSYEDVGGATAGYPPNKRFDFNRLGRGRGRGRGRGIGARGGLGGGVGGSSQVIVRNIPLSLNTIAHLNNHFARFGTLVNVQVQCNVIIDNQNSTN